MAQPPIRTLSTRIAFQSPWTTLVEDEIERPGGTIGSYAVVMKPRAALVIVWDGEHLHLVRQYRYPLKAWSVEFCQGTVNEGGMTPEEIAHTELREELGVRAASLEHLGVLAFAPGISEQLCDVWIATGLTFGKAEPELEEQGLLEHLIMAPEDLTAMFGRGELVDAATMAAWAMVQRRGGLPPG